MFLAGSERQLALAIHTTLCRHYDAFERLDVLTAGHACRQMTTGTSILLAICAISMSTGCAAAIRVSPDLLQLPPRGGRTGVIPGSWDEVAGLRPGARVVVTLTDDGRVEGIFRTLDLGDLGLTDAAGRQFGIARSNIRQIVARGEPDAVMDGALIGAGIGLGIAATILAIAASEDGYVLPSAKWGAPLLLSAVGGVIGVFTDRARTDDRVVYVGL